MTAESGAGVEPWSVYAVRFARRDDSRRNEHFYRSHTVEPEPYPIHYYVWACVRGEVAVVVDAGFTPETAERRGGREITCDVLDVLDQLGAGRAHHLVLTHLHYDHTGHVADLPAAHLHVQAAELEYWAGPYARRGDNPHLVEAADLAHVRARLAEGGGTVHDGDAQILPGLAVHKVGGHTKGLQVVSVATAGGTVVLASDATHFYDNIGADHPYSIVDHLPSMYDAFDWITATADAPDGIVPGHDPAVMDRYPSVDGLGGVAVRIA